MKLMNQYFIEMKAILAKIEQTQTEAIHQAASLIVDSLENDGVWHILDTGHMLMHEAVGRSGGLMAARPVILSITVENLTRRRERALAKKKVYLDGITGIPEYVFGASSILPGDALLIGSVSGKNILPVGVALEAARRGVKTIGLTSVEYSMTLQPTHPSGKRLCEVCDVVLDNCAPVGDALIHVDALDVDMCPASGVGAAYINWALQAEIVEILVSHGKNPSIYISNHMPNAGQRNAESWNAYEKLGY
jgi:uncharacterized phosphosugar-binding protein